MAIEKDALILASDIAAFNRDYLTVETEGRPAKTLGDDSEDWWFDGLYFNYTSSTGYYAIRVNLRDDSQYRIRFYDSVEHLTEIFTWRGSAGAPSLNTPGWAYSKPIPGPDAYENDWMHIEIPEGTQVWFKIDYNDEFGDSQPATWRLECKQGQNNISTGDTIRVWNEDWSALLPEESTIVTAILANQGRLGTD